MANTGGLVARSATASYDNALTFIPSVGSRDGDGIYFHQGSETEATRNRSPAGAGTFATTTGAVVFTSTHMECVSASAFLDTPHLEVETYTAFSVFSSSDTFVGAAHQPHPFGNFDGNSGSSIFVANHSTLGAPAARLRNNAYTASTNNIATVNVTNLTQYIFAISCVSVSAQFIRDMTNEFENDIVPAVGSRTIDATTMRIGSSRSLTATGTCNVVATGYFPNRYFDATQRALIYADVKAYLAQPAIGIAI